MNLLFTGRGGNGSYEIRGTQLAAACDAISKPNATRADIDKADAIVVVKRVPDSLLKAIRESGKPWAYDCLDCFPQPACSAWTRIESIAWVRNTIRDLDPTAVVWPNKRMRDDCDDGDRPSFVLPHHARPNMLTNPIREKVEVVGYEGRAEYLQEWGMALHRECERRGWTFTANPARLADVDIVVAFRGGKWDGYAPRNFKSNVKLANAHGSGTPFVARPDASYLETASGAEYWASSHEELRIAFDWLTPQSTRELVADRFIASAFTIEKAAGMLVDGMARI